MKLLKNDFIVKNQQIILMNSNLSIFNSFKSIKSTYCQLVKKSMLLSPLNNLRSVLNHLYTPLKEFSQLLRVVSLSIGTLQFCRNRFHYCGTIIELNSSIFKLVGIFSLQCSGFMKKGAESLGMFGQNIFICFVSHLNRLVPELLKDNERKYLHSGTLVLD